MIYFNLIYLLGFVFGLVVGSFLNCVIYRLNTGESFLRGRSFCPYCKHILSWKDLIPIFSFLILKGKCRYCGKKISFQYPLVEISTGILFVLIFSQTISDLRLTIYELIISCFLIVIFVYDLKHYLIPDQVIYPAIIISLIFSFLNSKFQILNSIYSAFGASLFFLSIYLISKGKWLGFGDVKLAFFMGLFLGFPKILPALFLSFFLGAIIGIGLILAKKKTLKSEVPFAPFLVAGTFIALFFGERLIFWYLNLLL
jgi:prepilin signal peptidase PulO-like enzyme (type II secretory pathway)